MPDTTNKKSISKAGITITIAPTDESANDPLDLTLYIKKPKEGEETFDPNDEGCFTASGNLTFKFGKKGTVVLFAENTTLINNNAEIGQEEDL